MNVSLIITTYNRSEFLYHSLRTISKQDLTGLNLEIIVVNDGDCDETENICETSDCASLLREKGVDLKCLYSGHRYQGYWRCMGFAANVGIRQSRGEIVILSNSDMYHLGNTIKTVSSGCELNDHYLGTLHKVYDDPGWLTLHLKNFPQESENSNNALKQILSRIKQSTTSQECYSSNPEMPFCLAIKKKHLIDIGGFDEDFIGIASEDCDLLDRLKAIGCRYWYAPPGVEAIHMYHGRKTIKQLSAMPGFKHNLQLRKERSKFIVRNVEREWGKPLNSQIPIETAPMSMMLWVTSQCNKNCPKCSQRIVMDRLPNYNMSTQELDEFILSCQSRKIRFSTITLSGGEPTLWPLFEQGVEKLCHSGIADQVTFITNGSNAKMAVRTANRHHLRYVVSKPQSSAEDIKYHEDHGVGVSFNEERHRNCPTIPLANTLPAICSQRVNREGFVVRELLYLNREVWYCCTAAANSFRLGVEEAGLRCSFNEDFDAYFKQRSFALNICAICTCNALVWQTLDEEESV